MEIQDFTKEIYDKYSSFYVLSKLDSDAENISIKLLTTEGEVDFDKKYLISKLPNGMFLFCSLDVPNLIGDCFALIASDGVNTEVINLQIYEKVRRFLVNPDGGFFGFFDSMPTTEIPTGLPKEDRCDYGLYGPVRFFKDDEPKLSVANLSQININEKILSVDGTGYIFYLKSSLDYDFYTNSDPFPRVASTIQESLKQILEWASVANDVWGNSEKIAINSKKFIETLHFDYDFINHINDTQPSMQIYKYLSGDSSARSKPEQPGEMTELIWKNILSRMSHLCLSNLLSICEIYIDNDLLEYIKQTEIKKLNGLKHLQINLLKESAGEEKDFSYLDADIDNVNDLTIDSLRSNIKDEFGDNIYNLVSNRLEIISNMNQIIR